MSVYNTISEVLSALNNNSAVFADVLAFIEDKYDFTPVAFDNGDKHNNANENNGSAKVFAVATLNNLSKEDTLRLFAEHYEKVVATPDDTDHDNIRNFMKFGWDGIVMATNPLQSKA